MFEYGLLRVLSTKFSKYKPNLPAADKVENLLWKKIKAWLNQNEYY